MENKPRYSRVSDIIELIILMQSRSRGVCLKDIEEHFRVSRRTAERMRDSLLNTLSQVEEMEEGGKVKYWGFRNYSLVSVINFSPDEIAALELIKESLSFDDKKDILEKTITKLKALSKKQEISKAEDRIELILKSEGVAVTQKPSYKIDIETLETIKEAIKENKKIAAIYNGKSKSLAPYGIIYASNIYLIGVEDKKKDPYVYLVHKLKDIALKDETFDKGDFNIKEYANRSFGVYQNELMQVELLFSKDAKEDVLNYNFHPTQKIKENKDGSTTVKFKASGELEIIWHVFKWGDKVKIVSPKKLKEQYKEYLKNVFEVQ